MTEKTLKSKNKKDTSKANHPKSSIAICTPMYGGMATQEYTISLLQIVRALESNGYEAFLVSTSKESLVAKARNMLAHLSLKKENLKGILFLDADQGVNAEDVLRMIESGKDIIGALVPIKTLNWTQVSNAAITNRQDLDLYSGSFAFHFLDPDKNDELNISYVDPFEVKYVGSGIMYVSKKVFTDLESKCKKYINNNLNGKIFSEEVTEYFYTRVVEETKELLSEDYNLCALWRESGNSVWAAPWVRNVHVGPHAFSGSFIHSIDLATTIDKLSETR
jgi:hypothetical protein